MVIVEDVDATEAGVVDSVVTARVVVTGDASAGRHIMKAAAPVTRPPMKMTRRRIVRDTRGRG